MSTKKTEIDFEIDESKKYFVSLYNGQKTFDINNLKALDKDSFEREQIASNPNVIVLSHEDFTQLKQGKSIKVALKGKASAKEIKEMATKNELLSNELEELKKQLAQTQKATK